MLFHDWPLLMDLLIVLPGFFALRKTRLWLPWLTGASYFFYGWWNPYYLLLVVYSTVLDFCLVLLMALGALYSSRRIWLLISVVNNLALLLFFKYARFIVVNLNTVFSSLHVSVKLSDPSTLMPFGFEYLLPVGISFFTFQSL